MADPVTWLVIAAVVGAAATVGSAISSHKQGEESLELQEEQLQAEEEYREEQRKIQISELEAQVASLRESMGGIGGQAMYEYQKIGESGLETYSAQRALTALGGAETGAGSPLQVMTGTLRMAQGDLAYKQAYYATELARMQAEIGGLEEQLDILRNPTDAGVEAAVYTPEQPKTLLEPPTAPKFPKILTTPPTRGGLL